MDVRRILLIESLDAAGAAARDARTRMRALLAAGYETRCAIVEPAGADTLHVAPVAEDALRVRADARGLATLSGWLAATAADLVLVASTAQGGGAVGTWLAHTHGRRAWWWPAGISVRARLRGAARDAAPSQEIAPPRHAGPLPALPWTPATIAGEPWPGAWAGLEASVCAETRPARGQLPLWDGDYVLAPAALDGVAGEAAIGAFAALCEEHVGLDLVVLADPQSAFERLARARGIMFRVHFAGPAPRDAELAWLGSASAALMAGDAPLSGGLVLRALAASCPLLAAPGAASGAPMEGWLAARGLAVGDALEPLPMRLQRALNPDSAWRERARAAIAHHAVESVAARLARALASVTAERRAA